MNQRRIDFKDVYLAWAHPDKSEKAQTDGAYKYSKHKDSKFIVVVAKKNDQGKWVVLTCWQKEIIDYKNAKKPKSGLSFWQNLWRMLSGR